MLDYLRKTASPYECRNTACAHVVYYCLERARDGDYTIVDVIDRIGREFSDVDTNVIGLATINFAITEQDVELTHDGDEACLTLPIDIKAVLNNFVEWHKFHGALYDFMSDHLKLVECGSITYE